MWRFIIEREIEAPARFQAIQTHRAAMAILRQQVAPCADKIISVRTISQKCYVVCIQYCISSILLSAWCTCAAERC